MAISISFSVDLIEHSTFKSLLEYMDTPEVLQLYVIVDSRLHEVPDYHLVLEILLQDWPKLLLLEQVPVVPQVDAGLSSDTLNNLKAVELLDVSVVVSNVANKRSPEARKKILSGVLIPLWLISLLFLSCILFLARLTIRTLRT